MATGRIPDPNSAPITAKGDLYTYSTVPARLAVGNDGETLVADSSQTTGLAYREDYAAGKNKIINGDFRFNQRGFTSTTTAGTYGQDRFLLGAADGTVTYTPQTFTTGAAPVAGYEGTNFAQIVTTGQTLTTANASLQQRIESVRTLASQTATISFYAKANTGTPNIVVNLAQNFGSGGSPSATVTTAGTAQAITTSWARYSFTIALPSISGKTLGTTNDGYLGVQIYVSGGSTSAAPTVGIQSNTFQIWGVQVEDGSVATAFNTATGTIQGELAACQRYYQKTYNTDVNPATNTNVGMAGFVATAADRGAVGLRFPVNMRTTPTVTIYSETGTSGAISNIAGTNVGSSAQSTGTGMSGFRDLYATSGLTVGASFFFHYVASAEL